MRPLTLRTILVATDLDRSSDAALDAAHRLAQAAGASLHVIHVPGPTQRRDASTSRRNDSTDAVRAVLRRASVPEEDAKIHLVPGSPADAIRSLADRMAVDVIVIGPHRERHRAGHRNALGGTARAVAVGAFAPCLVVAQSLRLPIERMLVPIDLSDTARGALLVGLSWASALRGETTGGRRTTLTVLHVDAADEDASNTPGTSVDHELEILRRSAGGWAGVSVLGVTRKSTNAARTIVDDAVEHKADLVVLGTRGLGLDEAARLGSVSASVSTELLVPMLLVPPAVWRAYAAVP